MESAILRVRIPLAPPTTTYAGLRLSTPKKRFFLCLSLRQRSPTQDYVRVQHRSEFRALALGAGHDPFAGPCTT
jgi:hypothetical protein